MRLKKINNLPLDKFINFCLYDKKVGYYMKNNPFGKKGDFTTAPNISRLFSEMIAIWAVSYWKSLGSPNRFNLIELGAGNGEMLKIMLDSFKNFPIFLNSCNIIIHEKSPSLIKIQKEKIKARNIKWIKKLSEIDNIPSIFLANEFFDSMPIKQFLKRDNNWFEKYVKFSNDKNINFYNKKINIFEIEKKLELKISSRQNFIEYSPLALIYLKKIFNIIKKNNGGLLIIDYGYNEKKMKDTLQAIYNKKYSNVLENVGKSDITYNLNFFIINNIMKNFKTLSSKFTTQREFLINLGIIKRAEIISANKVFTKKADIFYRLQRLIDKKEMGNLFKVMLIKKFNNNFQIGF